MLVTDRTKENDQQPNSDVIEHQKKCNLKVQCQKILLTNIGLYVDR